MCVYIYIYIYIERERAIVPSTVSGGNCHTTVLTLMRQVQEVNAKQTFGESSDHVCSDTFRFCNIRQCLRFLNTARYRNLETLVYCV